MKKSLLILTSVLVLFSNSISKPVSFQTVERVAINWMIERSNLSDNQIQVREVYPITYDSITVYYIVNMKPDGFVVVAGEDNVIPVIMYSNEGSFDPGIQLPSFDFMMKNVKEEIHYAVTNHLQPYPETKNLWLRLSAENTSFSKIYSIAAVSPLLKTTWNQNWPYNKYCPPTATGGDGGHVYTGCVATAMSQVMSYYQRPIRGYGSYSYMDPSNPAQGDPGYGTQSANFGSTAYDWKHMPKSLSGSSDSVRINAIAALMYHAGVSVDMDYAPDGSGAYMSKARNALVNYFRFSSDAAHIIRQNYALSDWVNVMSSELDKGRPVLYGGNDMITGGAHAFILDGYQGTDYFHIDWGWGGYLNGYFYLNNLIPGSYNFGANQDAVIKIIPLDWTTFTPPSVKNLRSIKTVDQNVVWICGDQGTIIHSSDNGTTWITAPFADQTYNLCSIDAVNASVAWIVGNKGSNGDAKIWKTIDGGNSWIVQFSSANAGACFRAVKFYDQNNGILIGDPENNHYVIMTTTNGGKNWTKIADANIPDQQTGEKGVMNNLAINGNCAWFGTGGGQWLTRVYRSSNRGGSWQVSQVLNGLDINLAATSFASDMIGLTLGANGNISKSSDGGKNWSSAIFTNAIKGGEIQHLGGSIFAMVGGRGGFFISTDDGST